MKTKPHVVAMEDDEYPEWLWSLLDEKRPGAMGEKVDLAGIYHHIPHSLNSRVLRAINFCPIF
jgi:hypothetical protein